MFDAQKDAVVEALHNDNNGLSEALLNLKEEMDKAGAKDVLFDKPLPLNNREGRKRFQAYAKKFGITVKYPQA